MRLVYQPGESRQVFYTYRNMGIAPVDLYVSVPPTDATCQSAVRLSAANLTPLREEVAGVNRVRCYRVSHRTTLRLTWTCETRGASLEDGTPADCPQLAEDDRADYLQPSPQLSRGPEIVAQSHALMGDEKDPLTIARAFFDDLVANYRYMYPVRNRGALAMQRSRRGDCGQFTALFVAWCRAVGIPARPVVGTFIGGFKPHVWAEFWLDKVGWVPVDPSYGQALSMDSGTEAAARVFGRIEPTRMAFSYDYDLRASWYGKPVRGVLLGRLMTIAGPRFEGRRLRWGYETLEGGIPFLQPAYPRGRGGLATVIRLSSLGDWASTARGPGWRVVARDVIGQLAVLAACVSFALSVIAPMAQGSLQTGVRLLTIVVLGTFILIPIITSEAFVRRLRMHRS